MHSNLVSGEAGGSMGAVSALDRAMNRDEFTRALLIYLDPAWLGAAAEDARLCTLMRGRAALLLASLGCQEEGRGLLGQVATYWMCSGQPARALAAAVQLRALGADVAELFDQFSALYHIQSPYMDSTAPPQVLDAWDVRVDLDALDGRVSDFERRAFSHAQLSPQVEGAALGVLLEQLVERAAAIAPQIPQPAGLPAMPLLSRLPAPALRSVLEHLEMEVYAHAQAVAQGTGDGGDLLWTATDDFCVEAGAGLAGESAGAAPERYRLPAGTLIGLNGFGGAARARAWDVFSHANAELLRLPRAAITALNQQLGDFHSRVTTLRRHALIEGLLERHPLFAQCDRAARVDLVQRFRGLHVAQGALLIAQGGRSPGIFLALDGRVDVFLRAATSTVRLGALGDGELFGAIGVVSDSPAMADYRMAQAGHLLYLPAEEFALAAADHPGLARFAVQLANQRMEAIRAAMTNAQQPGS